MFEPAHLQASLPLRSRSMGVKLIVIGTLALLMTIPAFFVEGIVSDRRSRNNEVVREVSSSVGGQQTFLGPLLAIPYTVPAAKPGETEVHGTYLVCPAQATATAQVDTEERHRSLFRVPVFHADLKLDSTFDLSGVPQFAVPGAVMDWAHAEFVVGVSDARGASADATLTANGQTAVMAPADAAPSMSFGGEHAVRLTLFGAHVASLAAPGATFTVSSMLHFSGAQRLAVLAYGKTTRLNVQSNWPDPGFEGGFFPASRSITPSGFKAEWSVPFIARGVRAEGQAEAITGLEDTAMAVSLVEVADPYQSVDRALKYTLLFLGLVFLTYFTFEVTAARRVHPAQYVLVGVAQLIFYLLLLAFAERVGFDLGFLIGGAATVGLLAMNAAWVFASRVQGLRALGVFSLLYALIYILLRLEDNALLVGAAASFAAVAAVMYFTRHIDWYGTLHTRPAGGADAE